MKMPCVIRFRLVTQVLLAIFCLLVSPAQAQQCRLALVLALDVSGSVNEAEYNQQITGLVAALSDPDVRSLILFSTDAPVSLAIYEWSSRNHQYVIQPWISLDGPGALDRAITRIRSHQKVRAGLRTAMGTALEFGAAMLAQQSHCWQHTIDVSGDGKNNIGVTPQELYRAPVFAGITVNALVVGNPNNTSSEGTSLTPQSLKDYYETEVIHGPEAFAMIAYGYGDYARAMRRKLLRELSFPVLGRMVD
ncbi:DUF1194 domain-containing protein [Loktanella sp. Alg231-35]|uniref:DUF1194 domain-containing protein n=1 Tax=Loktanella sp. Alg231-35 TaxID=1922220 RepID=UPI000D558DB4|nr:DUF1194 domain-containing protein [Loktanella sp. Alg231-35]